MIFVVTRTLTLLAVLAAASASAGLVPGGGPGQSDCYVELDVAGIQNGTDRVQKGKTVLCTDGEGCDLGACGDNVCTVSVAVCANQKDPALPACTPPAALKSLKVRGKLSVQVPQRLQGPVCSQPVTGAINATLNKKGKYVKGKSLVTLKATAKAEKGTKPASDQDTFTIQCLPRTVACPPPTTTTTTLTPATTTTTTGPDLPPSTTSTSIVVTTSTSTTTTIPPVCLNGVVEAGEECDDGNQDDTDGCTTACTTCGNRQITAPETCDDGNLANEDFCPSDCKVDFCQPTLEELTATIELNTPDVAALTVLMDYPEGQVSLQGIGGDIPPGILVGPGTATTQGFDFDHALRVVAFDIFNFGTTTMATIKFNRCQGAPAPAAQDFSCRLEGNASDESFALVPGVTCSVTLQ
jgi:cysteine-rich repeat protein